MGPPGKLKKLTYQIRGALGVARIVNPGPLDCAICAKRIAMMHGKVISQETSGHLICRSCFAQVLKMAAKTSDSSLQPAGAQRGTRGARRPRRKVS